MSKATIDLTDTTRRHREGASLDITAAEIRETLEEAETGGALTIGTELEDLLDDLELAAYRDQVGEFADALRRLKRELKRWAIDVRWER